MARFAVGQHVELYPTIQAEGGGSIDADTRGIVQDIDDARKDARIYRVGFAASERIDAQAVWLPEIDLFPALPPRSPTPRGA